MITTQEKQRLIQAHATEQVCVKAVITKCSVCLLVIAGIASIGLTMSPDNGKEAQTIGVRYVQINH